MLVASAAVATAGLLVNAADSVRELRDYAGRRMPPRSRRHNRPRWPVSRRPSSRSGATERGSWTLVALLLTAFGSNSVAASLGYWVIVVAIVLFTVTGEVPRWVHNATLSPPVDDPAHETFQQAIPEPGRTSKSRTRARTRRT